MIVGLLANRVALAPKLVKSLIQSIAEVARGDAKEYTDLQWFRTSFIALINLVQVIFEFLSMFDSSYLIMWQGQSFHQWGHWAKIFLNL